MSAEAALLCRDSSEKGRPSYTLGRVHNTDYLLQHGACCIQCSGPARAGLVVPRIDEAFANSQHCAGALSCRVVSLPWDWPAAVGASCMSDGGDLGG